MATTYLLLGSNIGDRVAYLQQAQARIAAVIGPVVQYSNIYETAAWGLTNQQAFLNQVLQVTTVLPPEILLTSINKIENNLGRVREIKWAARVIDIDILFYEKIILQTSKLTIPHPHLHHRRFTLVPLAEIAPSYCHPILQKTTVELLDMCTDNLPVTIYQN
jgi:2-amino-4-hydroxy-6-hydroxymethyldihydropteridine diphosphokinase